MDKCSTCNRDDGWRTIHTDAVDRNNHRIHIRYCIRCDRRGCTKCGRPVEDTGTRTCPSCRKAL